MKQLFLFASMMLSITSYAQWDLGNYVDDFGVETGDIFLHQTAMGVFSNSVTINSKCAYFLEHNKADNQFGITIYPYARKSPETWYDDTFQDVKIKKPSGDVVVIEAFCFDGMVYFSDEEYDQLMEALSERGEYSFAMKHKTNYSKSSYRFKFQN
jgi:hypothetical protein